jgi:hypothetical protein
MEHQHSKTGFLFVGDLILINDTGRFFVVGYEHIDGGRVFGDHEHIMEFTEKEWPSGERGYET